MDGYGQITYRVIYYRADLPEGRVRRKCSYDRMQIVNNKKKIAANPIMYACWRSFSDCSL